jgi:8-oxo-dGTP diphosphatase
MKKIEVVAAVIVDKGKVLCVQRGPAKYEYISKKWEFPGGKVEIDESNIEALQREIKEELHVDITVKDFLITVDHEYPDFELVMHSFICSTNSTKLTLTEHINFEWLEKSALKSLDWAEADVPIVEKLMQQ